MCKRCVKLELQLSLFTLSAQLARVWSNNVKANEHFYAVQRLRAAEQALNHAEDQLRDHRRHCHFTQANLAA